MAAPLVARLVMDAAGYLKTVDTAIASNTKLDASFQSVGETASLSASRQVAASLKASKALEEQVVGYRELAASATASAETQARAALLAERAEARLNSQLGLGIVATRGASKEAQVAQRDFREMSRGILAGSGAASGLGRSLAFASTGFVAVASGATILKASIGDAIDLAKTQRQVDAQLKTSGKSWDQYGARVDAADLKLSRLSGFTNQELLQGFGYLVRVTGNVGEALKLTGVAADVARGRNISLSSASIALAKALGGSETALKRLGITIPPNVKGMDALNYVAAKFAGQAKAGATEGDHLHATLVDTGEVIGTELLPTFVRLSTEFGDWLQKMNESGRLEKDVNRIVTDTGHVFHFAEGAIRVVDKATGGFENTLKILLALKVASIVTGWIGNLGRLAAGWDAVTASATRAKAAETIAMTTPTPTPGGGGSSLPFFIPPRPPTPTLPERVAQYTGEGAAGAAAVGRTAFATRTGIARFLAPEALFAAGGAGVEANKAPYVGSDGFVYLTFNGKAYRGNFVGFPGSSAITIPGFTRPGTPVNPFPQFALPFGRGTSSTQSAPGGLFGGISPIQVWKAFQLTLNEQISQVEAGMTKTLADDVAVAKQIISRINHLIDIGKVVPGTQAYLQALQAEASAESTLQQAQAQAAAKRQAAAAKALQLASTYTTPIDLQIAEVQAEMTKTTRDDLRVEREIIAAARRAIASGEKNKQGRLAALETILQAQQAIQALTSQSNTTYTLPLKLQLALAKAEAFGGDQTRILEKMKAALLKAYKAAKGNVQKQIDILNQIAGINSQLESSAQAAFGNYKQASLAAETAGLGLTHAQRKALEARLSQRGPGGTAPGPGVGAAGYMIGPDGRPVQIHHHRRPHQGRATPGAGGSGPRLQATFNIRIELDGRDITRSVTIRQQQNRDRNPPQRRGPHAGKQVA